MNSITVATRPAAWPPSQTVPAKMAIQQPCPTTANIINFRRPSLHFISGTEKSMEIGASYRSITQMGTKEEKK